MSSFSKVWSSAYKRELKKKEESKSKQTKIVKPKTKVVFVIYPRKWLVHFVEFVLTEAGMINKEEAKPQPVKKEVQEEKKAEPTPIVKSPIEESLPAGMKLFVPEPNEVSRTVTVLQPNGDSVSFDNFGDGSTKQHYMPEVMRSTRHTPRTTEQKTVKDNLTDSLTMNLLNRYPEMQLFIKKFELMGPIMFRYNPEWESPNGSFDNLQIDRETYNYLERGEQRHCYDPYGRRMIITKSIIGLVAVWQEYPDNIGKPLVRWSGPYKLRAALFETKHLPYGCVSLNEEQLKWMIGTDCSSQSLNIGRIDDSLIQQYNDLPVKYS